MNQTIAQTNGMPTAGGIRSWQPNELDLRRIERMLQKRARYLYVVPRVEMTASGYLIQSPCCSRNIDAEGGMVDIALLEYDAGLGVWKLFRKDHTEGGWEFFMLERSLQVLMDCINRDTARLFWQ